MRLWSSTTGHTLALIILFIVCGVGLQQLQTDSRMSSSPATVGNSVFTSHQNPPCIIAYCMSHFGCETETDGGHEFAKGNILGTELKNKTKKKHVF